MRKIQLIVLVLYVAIGMAAPRESFTLATDGKTAYRIAVRGSASETERFAAGELQRYLRKMSGATLPIVEGEVKTKAILVGTNWPSRLDAKDHGLDGYLYRAAPSRIAITGISDRGTLFAVYAFLEELGCRWFAPNFEFYGEEGGELVPQARTLRIPVLRKSVRPSLKYRKTDLGEVLTHDAKTLRQIVEWMPKAGMNVLEAPMDFQGKGTAPWEKWRADLVPETKKRGLLLEIGGHGYQNFLPASRYFEKHPEWFGVMDGKRSNDPRVVFESTNTEAMAELVRNVEAYLRGHPEIGIFDLWPPDSARWSQSPESEKLGPPPRRHAFIVNAVSRMMRQKFPRVRLQFIAYTGLLFPPDDVQIDADLMDFCPAERSFQSVFWSEEGVNRSYAQALPQWLKRDAFKGDISVYTYYRKYIFRSLPVVFPRLIAREVHYMKAAGLNGAAIFSEPADWLTFELTHYIFARALMDADLDIDKELRDYMRSRFGGAWEPLMRYFAVLEQVMPGAAAIPCAPVHSAAELKEAAGKLSAAGKDLQEAARLAKGTREAGLIRKLDVSRRYALNDVRIREAAAGFFVNGFANLGRIPAQINTLADERRELFNSHLGEGLFYKGVRTTY